jgi:hypothetical protein
MAVRHGYGKIAGTDALVFAYDTGDTRNSYRGEPTTNYTTDTPSQGGWSGTYNVLDSSRKTFRLNVSNFNGSPGAGWRSFTWDLRAYAGQSVTISATVEVPSSSPGTFAWIMMGQTSTHTNNGSGVGTYLGYSTASERVQKTSTTRERITWSGTLGNSGTASQPSGNVGFTVWYNDGTPGTNSYVEVSDVQIELKSHATPFVNGTRSATQGLLDLTGNSSVNLTNMSFDSNAQMTFDGTSDYINFPAGTMPNFGTNDFAIEVVFKMTKSTSYSHFYQVKDQYYFALKMSNGDQRIYVYRTSALSTYNSIPADTTLGAWHHLVCQRNGDNIEMYLNGAYKGSKSGWGSIDIDGDTYDTIIGKYNNEYSQGDQPVTKIYNRALTAGEVKNNYSHYKNRFGI